MCFWSGGQYVATTHITWSWKWLKPEACLRISEEKAVSIQTSTTGCWWFSDQYLARGCQGCIFLVCECLRKENLLFLARVQRKGLRIFFSFGQVCYHCVFFSDMMLMVNLSTYPHFGSLRFSEFTLNCGSVVVSSKCKLARAFLPINLRFLQIKRQFSFMPKLDSCGILMLRTTENWLELTDWCLAATNYYILLHVLFSFEPQTFLVTTDFLFRTHTPFLSFLSVIWTSDQNIDLQEDPGIKLLTRPRCNETRVLMDIENECYWRRLLLTHHVLKSPGSTCCGAEIIACDAIPCDIHEITSVSPRFPSQPRHSGRAHHK